MKTLPYRLKANPAAAAILALRQPSHDATRHNVTLDDLRRIGSRA
jgi:hypothetical protein